MGYHKVGLLVVAVLATLLLCSPSPAVVTVTAYDDAADAVYNPGIYQGLNGGTGFNAWQTNAFPFGGNPNLQHFVSTSSVNGPPGPDIDTGGRAWGNYVSPGSNTFYARRSLTADVTIGGTFSIDFDTGSNDGRETVSFGQQSGALPGFLTICQFYLDSSLANYQFYDALTSTTTDTGILQTFGGLSLTLTRNSANTYSFNAVRLTDSLAFNMGPLAYDNSTITNLRSVLVSNFDAGNGLGHSMYVNRLQATEVPEPSSLLALGAIASTMLMRRRTR